MSATRDESTQATESAGAATDEVTESAQQGGVTEQGDEPTTLPVDRVFELLKNERRREVLRYLERAESETVSLSDLAEHIAAIENDTTVQTISSSERKRVYVGLYQCHLPKMDDMNVVAFDQNRGTISLDPNADQLETFLDIEGGGERPWTRYYAAIAAAGAVLYGIALVVPAVSVGVVVPLVVLAFVGCAIANEYADRQREETGTV